MASYFTKSFRCGRAWTCTPKPSIPSRLSSFRPRCVGTVSASSSWTLSARRSKLGPTSGRNQNRAFLCGISLNPFCPQLRFKFLKKNKDWRSLTCRTPRPRTKHWHRNSQSSRAKPHPPPTASVSLPSLGLSTEIQTSTGSNARQPTSYRLGLLLKRAASSRWLRPTRKSWESSFIA